MFLSWKKEKLDCDSSKPSVKAPGDGGEQLQAKTWPSVYWESSLSLAHRFRTRSSLYGASS